MTQVFGSTSDCANGTQMADNQLDSVASFKVNDDGNNGKVYGSDTAREWRLYQSNNPQFEIYVADGYAIQSVKVTFTNSNSGTLLFNGEKVTSGTDIAISPIKASVTFTVGNTSASVTNGQIKVTAISVTYVPAA